jgi:CHAT domain-containing protein
VDLLVLSACETALDAGRDAQGREIEGLGTLAQKKGAGAVLATLWPVADLKAGLLLGGFYRHCGLAKGGDLAGSLRKAQVALIRTAGKGEDYSHPFYWAPYILMGHSN